MGTDKTDIEKLIEDESFRNWVLRSNQEDFEKWETLLNRDKELKQVAEEAKSIVLLTELTENTLSEKENKDALARLMDKIGLDEAGVNDETKSIVQPHYASTWKRYAAIALLLAVVGVSLSYLVNINQTKEERVAIPEIERSTQSGQFLTLQLPDGSKVKLNSNSTVKLPEYFIDERVVKLEGEAFFEVTRNPELPFKVVTKNFTVEVIGTSFNINSYENQQPKVSVETGIVKVKQRDADSLQITLTKNQAALFDHEKNQLVSTNFDPDELLWRDGILIFRNDNIHAIATKLEHWYGVTITISDPEKITGQFNGTYEKEALENLLDGIGYVLNFSYQMDRTKNKITITPN